MMFSGLIAPKLERVNLNYKNIQISNPLFHCEEEKHKGRNSGELCMYSEAVNNWGTCNFE